MRTIAALVEEYLIVHQSQGHSPKTLEWHSTALGLLVRYLEEQGVTNPHAFETSHLREWVVWLGAPESVRRRQGRTSTSPHSKRTIHTYTRSAHAFGKWLHEEGYTDADVINHLETPTFAVKLLRGVPNRPSIYVELRAYGLHTHEGGMRAVLSAHFAEVYRLRPTLAVAGSERVA